MAIKLFKNLFRKNKKGHIGLTAEEAYAPLTAYPAWEEDKEEEIRYIPEEKEPVCDPQAEASAPEKESDVKAPEVKKEAPADQTPVSVWMYGFVEEREIAKTLIRTGIISAFRSVSEDKDGFHCRLTPDTRINVNISTDPENVTAQAGYLISRFQNAYLSNRDVKNAALMQIEVFNAFAEFTLLPPYSKEDVDLLVSAVYKIAETVYGFVLNDRAELYRWDKKLLISEDGHTDFTEFMPIRRSGSAVSKAEADAADEARRLKSIEILKNHDIDIPADMPVQIPESKAKLRESEDIVNRLAPLFTCALKGHAYTSPVGIAAPHAFVSNAVKRLDNQYGVSRLFTQKEAEYIVRGREQQHPAFLLRFESCTVLLWALGLVNMGWPDEACDTHSILRILRDADTEMLLKIAKPRPLNVILNMHDITYRLHSICVRCDEETQKAYSIDPDVVYERHYALNWLIAANGISDWDLVVPKT